MSFEVDINKWANKVNLSVDNAIVAVCAQISTEVIKRTPVDTGRARANWIPSIGTPSDNVTDNTDTSGILATNKALNVSKVASGKMFWLVNNLPYIQKLEYGWSNQAPHGMVRLTMQQVKNSLKGIR